MFSLSMVDLNVQVRLQTEPAPSNSLHLRVENINVCTMFSAAVGLSMCAPEERKRVNEQPDLSVAEAEAMMRRFGRRASLANCESVNQVCCVVLHIQCAIVDATHLLPPHDGRQASASLPPRLRSACMHAGLAYPGWAWTHRAP